MGSLIGFIIMLVDAIIIMAMMEDEKRGLTGLLLTIFVVAALVWGIGLDHSEPIKCEHYSVDTLITTTTSSVGTVVDTTFAIKVER